MSVKVEEKSLQLALVKAAGQLGTTQDAMSYKILNQSSGFLGVFGKKVAIEAWKTSGKPLRRQKPSRGRVPSRDNRGELAPEVVLSEQECSELKETLREFCAEVCYRMLGREVEVEAKTDDGRLILNICDEELAQQLSKNGRLAEAFEHILRKKPRLHQELPFRIFVDMNGVRRCREAELITMARDLSDKVHESKRPIVLNYRNSYDRKVIHVALDRDDRVYTKSIGSGPNRKLMILPSKDEMSTFAAEED
ncbi:MAG: Jag N-terminal domain-containing protein [Deltaproteobacteria bacterium]|nr:Jag N-terminal domain-containing protein [Deltaproteobacteria bacterium]